MFGLRRFTPLLSATTKQTQAETRAGTTQSSKVRRVAKTLVCARSGTSEQKEAWLSFYDKPMIRQSSLMTHLSCSDKLSCI